MHRRNLCIFTKRTCRLRAPKRPLKFYVNIVGLQFAYRDPGRDVVFLWIGTGRRSMLGLWGRLQYAAVTRTHAILPLRCPCPSFSALANGSTVWASRPAISRVRKRPNLQSLDGCPRRNFIFAIRMVTRLSSSLSLMTRLTPTSSAHCPCGERRPNPR